MGAGLKITRRVRQKNQGARPEPGTLPVELFRKTGPTEKIDHNLTPHEVRLLGLLAAGYQYKEAADKLNLIVNTVRTYVRSIYEKLHVRSKTEAVFFSDYRVCKTALKPSTTRNTLAGFFCEGEKFYEN